MRDHARILSIVASEAVGEPDAVSRRPEVIDTLVTLSRDPHLRDIVEGVAPGVLPDPATDLAQLADALAPYRERPLDDAPELVERLALVAWILAQATSDSRTTERSPALSSV